MESLPSARRQRMGWRLMKCIGDREGGGAGKNKRWLDECLWYVQRRDQRDTEILQPKRSTAGAAFKSVSHDMNSRFPRVEAFRTRFQERIRERR